MCLIAIAWKQHPRIRLALIANRDESHARPTAAAAFDDAGDVYGGRDLQAGGSWLQVSRRGRLAAVTNVRDGRAVDAAGRSRGDLVSGFVRGSLDARTHADALLPDAGRYGRFNLLLWDGPRLHHLGNHPRPHDRAVAPGLYGMSNGAFDAPWPKSLRARERLDAWLRDTPGADIDPGRLEPLFEALRDATPANDAELPDTGVPLALERRLSPAFIEGEEYGTRSSSIVLVQDRRILFAERRYGPGGRFAGESVAWVEMVPGVGIEPT